MSKAIIIQDLTSQLIQMNFICTYHPKYDLYSDMFFDCQDSDEEPSKINLVLAFSIDEKQKELKYYHRVSEYSEDGNNRIRLSNPIESFHQFVSYQTITGKTKHIYLDPEEITEFFKKSCEKYDYRFIHTDEHVSLKTKKPDKTKYSVIQSIPLLTILTLLTLTTLSWSFHLLPRDWIVSLVLAIIFILSIQMIPKRKVMLTAGWITLQILIWLIY
jgi:hypothetical protein